jgi:ABC-type Fe3+-citrate transport system substrate-binding protein
MENSLDLRSKFQKALEEFLETSDSIEKRLTMLEEKEKKWKELEKMMEENAAKAKQKIKLDIGGKIFTTSKSTLMRYENTYFYAMLASGKWQPDEDGTLFIF